MGTPINPETAFLNKLSGNIDLQRNLITSELDTIERGAWLPCLRTRGSFDKIEIAEKIASIVLSDNGQQALKAMAPEKVEQIFKNVWSMFEKFSRCEKGCLDDKGVLLKN